MIFINFRNFGSHYRQILSASTPSDLQSLQELGEGLGHCLSKKAHSNGSDLVVKLAVDCSREVDICLQNS